MKRIVILFISLTTFTFAAIAQCDKKVIWTAPKAELMDTNGKVEDFKNEKIVVETTKTQITLKRGENEEEPLTGTVAELACQWKEPFKNGKTTFKTVLTNTVGEIKEGTVTIEGKDGKIIIYVQIQDMDGKTIKISVDSYKETI